MSKKITIFAIAIIWPILKYFKMLNMRAPLIGAGEILILYMLLFLAYQ
jgi:hypothetical protein